MATNKSLLTSEDLTYTDTRVFSPKTVTLYGRSLFQSISVPSAMRSYRYEVVTATGSATESVDRSSDDGTVDLDANFDQVPIFRYSTHIDYTDEELEEANALTLSGKPNLNVLNLKIQRAARNIAEFEDKLIFAGHESSNPKFNAYGLLSDPAKAGFASLANTNPFDNAKTTGEQKLAFLKAAAKKITDLPGYIDNKPILLLGKDAYDALDVRYNDYDGTSLLDLAGKWFSSIQPIPELSKGVNGLDADAGIVLLNDSDMFGIPDAQPLYRVPQVEYTNDVYTIRYKQRTGGLVVRYPSGVVRLTGILSQK